MTEQQIQLLYGTKKRRHGGFFIQTEEPGDQITRFPLCMAQILELPAAVTVVQTGYTEGL